MHIIDIVAISRFRGPSCWVLFRLFIAGLSL